MKKLSFILAAAIIFVACGTQKTTAPQPELAGQWTITQLGETIIPDSLETQLTFCDSLGMYSAYVGCNRINGSWSNTDSLVLTDGLSTKMYCEGLMELEQALCEALPQVKKALLLESGDLALQSAEGATLLVITRE